MLRRLFIAAALLATVVAALAGCQREAFEDRPIREVVSTDAAPEAIGPYSQAVRVGNTLYLAGQIAISAQTGQMVEGGIEAETRQVMNNLDAVLDAAGFSMAEVVQSQVFLADLEDFQRMNAVYAEYFERDYPVRATVEAARLPRDARVEIMMTAVRR